MINRPLPHLLVIIVEHFETFLYIAIMVNLICYIILKLAYFVYFGKMNTLLDETILLTMRMVSLGLAALSVVAQILWKVCGKGTRLLKCT